MARLIVKNIIKTNQKFGKTLAKIALDFQKFATKKTSPNVFLVLLTFICLYFIVKKPKVIENVLHLILFINKFIKVITNIFILKIGLLLRLNIKLIFK